MGWSMNRLRDAFRICETKRIVQKGLWISEEAPTGRGVGSGCKSVSEIGRRRLAGLPVLHLAGAQADEGLFRFAGPWRLLHQRRDRRLNPLRLDQMQP